MTKDYYEVLEVSPNASQGVPAQASENGATESAPICAIHNKPMTKVQGAKGSFWSCHEKLADGSFCPYKPPKAA